MANQLFTEPLAAVTIVGPALTTMGAMNMSDSYIIEVGSRTAGIVVRDRAGFRFFAALPQFDQLEGQLFRSAREAERAAAQSAGRANAKPS